MDLKIEPTLVQAVELRRRELELGVERAARGLRYREFRDRRAAHAEHRAFVQSSDGRGALETRERTAHGQLRAVERSARAAAAFRLRRGGRLDWDRRQTNLEGLGRVRAERRKDRDRGSRGT